jgi:tRNA A37 N6-isopentenylltransferase MiaA
VTYTIIDAISSLYPSAKWTMVGESYAGLNWLDSQIDKPTQAELAAEVTRLQTSWLNTQYQRSRAAEYPPIADYIDGVVKGDTAQVESYIEACLAVKAKYPKPE